MRQSFLEGKRGRKKSSKLLEVGQVKGSVLLSPILVVVVELAELATCFRPRKSTLTYPGIRGVGKKLSLLFLDPLLSVLPPREGK